MFQQRILQFYYLLTPVYFLLDYGVWFNIRTAGLDHDPVWKYGYYAFCFANGGAMVVWPKISSVSSLIECSVNFTMLVMGIMLPIFRMSDEIILNGTISNPVTAPQVINFLSTGSMLLISFYKNPLIRS